MKRIISIVLLAGMVGCAHGKMGQIDQAIDRDAVTKSTPIFVEPILAENASFSGDKANDESRREEDKAEIKTLYNAKIAAALRKRGYDAKAVREKVTSGIVISGDVRTIAHGSAASRIFLGGTGGGSSNLYTDFKVEDRTAKRSLGKFEIIATSGGRGGLAAAGSFMDAHLEDGAAKLAAYVEKGK